LLGLYTVLFFAGSSTLSSRPYFFTRFQLAVLNQGYDHQLIDFQIDSERMGLPATEFTDALEGQESSLPALSTVPD
jgi:hypothetical protein